jgi:hypothetical protein
MIEEKDFDFLSKNFRSKFEQVCLLVDQGKTPEEIAQIVGGRKIILGILCFLTAKHATKLIAKHIPCHACGAPRTVRGNLLLECPICGDCEKELGHEN